MRIFSKQVVCLLCLSVLITFTHTYAGMVPTQVLINAEKPLHTTKYTKADLQTALASASLRDQLQTMGVDTVQLNERIENLTPDEIHQLNNTLADQPAGGALGTLAAVFIFFVVTDMLCATDLFTFVKCIN